MPEDSSSIVLFDGHCNLCSGAVRFIIRRDPGARFMFAALQSDAGRERVRAVGRNPDELDTIILLEDGQVFDRSTAAVRIARRLRAPWPLAYALVVVPRFIRDPIYNWIARHRYRWFGRMDECLLPTEELLSRFLSQ